MMSRTPLLASLALVVLVAGCDRRPREEPPPPPEPQSPAPSGSVTDRHLPPGIPWYAGDVDAAFASAKTDGKPLFLYWGAEWCPPCAQIKSTIFNKREFQDRSRLFIPVYLDGDTPSAQRYGERFGVVGYPTMILFRPDGTEITRLPGNVDVTRYATILDVALADARPVAELVAKGMAGGDLTQNDWRLLAYNSWGSDVEGRVLSKDARPATFRTLSQRCPPELPGVCARLYFEYLSAMSAAGAKDGPSMDGLERADSRRRLLAVLADPAAQADNVDNLLYGAESIVNLLSDQGTTERRELVRAWSAALDRLSGASGGTPAALSAPEQLLLIRERIVLAKLAAPDAKIPDALLAEARKAIAEVDARTTDTYGRHAAINAAANLYWEAGLDADANTLLTAELEKSKSPYYFMLDLAELAEKAGRKEEAVQWLARAYEGARGPATRFQWGYNYLVGMLEMTPGDVAGIERAGLSVLGELDSAPDAFYQRTRMRLEQLDAKLLEWGREGEAAKVVETLRARSGEICRKLPEGDAGRANCEKFLNPAAHAA
jgi:thiol-disulfide isomerase/thioredoxin